MNTNTPANVMAAYEILLEELEDEIEAVNRQGAAAFGGGDHAAVARALQRAQALGEVRRDLLALGKRLSGLVERAPAGSEARARLGRGLKTPEETYRLPILRALVEMGGRGETSAVLDRVYGLIRDQLNEHDLAPMPSDEHIPRWRNTAQWARNSMREEGLIEADSPHGVWEISDAGRRAVEEATKPRK